ncbi:hypothetical protein [Streptomyces noursei]
MDLDDDSHEIGCIGDNRSLVDCGTYAASEDPEDLPAHQGIVFRDWRVMGATIVAQPAFPEAFIAGYSMTGDIAAESLTDASAITAAAIGNTSLPFAPRDRSWDGGGAKKRMESRARKQDGSLDVAKMSQGFLWRDDNSDPNNVGSYRFPFADVIDGELKAVFSGVVAAGAVVRGGRGGTKVPTAGIKSKITTLYRRAAREFKDPNIKPPWDNPARASVVGRHHTSELAIDQFAAAGFEPPDPWFTRPPFDAPTPWTVTGDRVFGHLALWNICHIGIDKRCVMAPSSQTGYAYYATKLLETRGGRVRDVGIITMDTGHATLEATYGNATSHYDNTGTMAAAVCIGEDEFGIWCAGSLLPHLDDEEKVRISLSSLSGDWRQVRGGMELVAALAVNVPGLPVTRARSGAGGSPFSALGCGALPSDEDHEERANHIFGIERQARVRMAAQRMNKARMSSMQKRMAALAAAPAEDDAAGAEEKPEPWEDELCDGLIAAIDASPEQLEKCAEEARAELAEADAA